MSYIMTNRDKERISTLLTEIEDKDINFKYFLTIDYYFKMTDDIRVLEDNKHLRLLLRRSFKRPIRFFFTTEKHLGNDLSPAFLGFHRHLLMEDIDDWNVSRPRRKEYKMDLIEKTIRRHHHSTPNGKLGLVIKPIESIESLMSYMTKQIDYPSLNIDKTKIIDVVNSDIGKNHYSVRGKKRCDLLHHKELVTA